MFLGWPGAWSFSFLAISKHPSSFTCLLSIDWTLARVCTMGKLQPKWSRKGLYKGEEAPKGQPLRAFSMRLGEREGLGLHHLLYMWTSRFCSRRLMKLLHPLTQVPSPSCHLFPRHRTVPGCESLLLLPGSAVLRDVFARLLGSFETFLSVWPGYQILGLEFHCSSFIGFLFCVLSSMAPAWTFRG